MKKSKFNKIVKAKTPWINGICGISLNVNVDENAIPRVDVIPVITKFRTIKEAKDESILRLLNKWPIDIEA